MASLGAIGKAAEHTIVNSAIETRYYLAGTLKNTGGVGQAGSVHVYEGIYPTKEVAAAYIAADGSWQVDNLVSAGPYMIIARDGDSALNAGIFVDVTAVEA